MNVEFQNDLYRLYYYDADKSIFVNEIYGRWTWEDAHTVVNHGNYFISSMSSPKYVISHFKDDGILLPVNTRYTLANLRRIMQLDQTDEDLVIFVGVSAFLKALINTISGIYGFFNQTARYRYARTFEDALKMIEAHKVSHANKAKLS
ncbi:MAG: hypothetical protein ACPG7F_15840 [Aggregatilineales bacterium]